MSKRNQQRQAERQRRKGAVLQKKNPLLENLNYLAVLVLLLLNLASLTWQVSRYWTSKEDKVSTSLSFMNLKCTGKMNIKAELINFGEEPLYVRSMVINLFRSDADPVVIVQEPGQSKVKLDDPTSLPTIVSLKEEKPENKPLQPMERRVYYANDLDIAQYAALAKQAGEDISLIVTANNGEIHRHKGFWYFFQKAEKYFTAEFIEQAQKSGTKLEVIVGDEFSLTEDIINGEHRMYVSTLTSPFQDSSPAAWKTVLAISTGLFIAMVMVSLAFKLGQRHGRTH